MTQAEKDALVAQRTAERDAAAAADAAADAHALATEQALVEAEAALAAANAIEVVETKVFNTVQKLNLAAVVTFTVQAGSARYSRHQTHREWTVDAINEEFRCTDFAGGGGEKQFAAGKYTMFVSRTFGETGVACASYTKVAGAKVGKMTGAFPADIPDGLVFINVVPDIPTTESYPTWITTLDRKGEAKFGKWVGYQKGSYDWTHNGGYHQVAVADKRLLGNSSKPLVAVTAEPFSTRLTFAKNELVATQYVVPVSGGVPRRPFKTARGNIVTEGRQPYAFSDIITSGYPDAPDQPIIPGPRGIGSAQMITYAQIGRNAKVYCCDPWSFFVIDNHGKKLTLVGLAQDEPVYWRDASKAKCRVVGDWDASIPVNQRFVWECWGMVFWAKTLELDETVPPIGGEQPHVGLGPVVFLCDRHGFVLKAQFNGKVREAPAKVTRHLAASDPWGLAIDGDTLYVAERGKSRISKWSAETGAYLGDFVSGPTNLGGVNNARYWSGSPPSVTRKHDCVGPESVRIQDGWVYWSSLAQADVRRKRIDGTGAVEICVQKEIGNNSNYVYFDLSDGTFGPRSTLFTTTWGLGNDGWPMAHCPGAGKAEDGAVRAVRNAANEIIGYDALDAAGNVTKTFLYPPGANATQKANTLKAARMENGTPLTHALRWEYEPSGEISYGSAVGVGQGLLACGSAMHGLPVIRKRLPTDPAPLPPSAARTRGAAWFGINKVLFHGPQCCDWLEIPPPWGENADCDVYLESLGLVKP